MEPKWHSAAYNLTLYEPGIKEVVLPIFSTYHHIPVILVAYLTIVKHYGPKFMQDRKPFDLKGVRMIYNLIQIVSNLYIFVLCVSLIGTKAFDPWGNGCYPVTSNTNDHPHAYLTMVRIGYYYYLNKIFDCIETVFFVLRKKQSQVSFLHMYHHLVMIFSIWVSIFYLREENLTQIAFINTLVHVVMYVYYFLSGLGPSVQKYLWWKKYITRLQLIQFLMGLTTLLKMSVSGCYNDSRFVIMWVLISTSLFCLFVHFYIKTYLIKKK